MFVSSLQGLYAEFITFDTFGPFVLVTTPSIGIFFPTQDSVTIHVKAVDLFHGERERGKG